MKKTLLVIAGIMNALFVGFHIYLGFRFYGVPMPQAMRGLLETFNAAGTLMIAFFAFAYLARGKEVLETGLGAGVIALSATIYLTRAAEEFIWLQGNLAILAVCVVAGLLHLALLPYLRLRTAESA